MLMPPRLFGLRLFTRTCLVAFCLLAALSNSIPAAAQDASTRTSENAKRSATGKEHVVFFAMFDCSWERAKRGPTEPTTVAVLHQRLQSASRLDVHSEYLKIDCAHENWFLSPDGGKAAFERQVLTMYSHLHSRLPLLRTAYPETPIAVVSIGGGWGAAQAAAFSRLLHERGIVMPGSTTITTLPDRHSVNFSVEPGKVAQAVIMLDPVGTRVDLPESVLSALQLVARDEKRDEFRSVSIVPEGLSPDKRRLGIVLPGSHSDVCGGYRQNGLALRTANLVVDRINRLSTEPLLDPFDIPEGMDVIHRSEQEEL